MCNILTHACPRCILPRHCNIYLVRRCASYSGHQVGRQRSVQDARGHSLVCKARAWTASGPPCRWLSNLPSVTLTLSWEAPRFLLPAMHEPQSAPQLHATCKYAAAGRCLLGIDSAATVFTPIRPPTLRHECHAFVPLLSCSCVQKWSVTSSLARFPRMSRLTRRWRSSRRYGNLATR